MNILIGFLVDVALSVFVSVVISRIFASNGSVTADNQEDI